MWLILVHALLGISSLEDISTNLPSFKTKEEKIKFIAQLSRKVVNNFSIVEQCVLQKPLQQTTDTTYDNARVFCHFASLALELKDAWSEVDGERVIQCLQVFMLHFKFMLHFRTRAARSVTTLCHITDKFDKETYKCSSSHNSPCNKK